MFDMGFAEILLIAVIGLIVIGPKRMPEAIRVLGYWIGKLRRTVQNARREMEQEFGLDEIRRDIHNQTLLDQWDKERKDLEKSLASVTSTSAQSVSPDDPEHLSSAETEEQEREMQQAFDDFDEEFGLDEDEASQTQSQQDNTHNPANEPSDDLVSTTERTKTSTS